MSDQTEHPTPPFPPEAPPPAPAAVAEPSAATAAAPIAASRAPAGLWLLAGLALLGALAALAATGWQLRQVDSQRDMAEFRLQSAIQEQSAQLHRLNERLADQRADSRAWRREQQSVVETLQGELRGQSQRLAGLTRGDRTDWRVAELEYLLQLARQRLLLGRTSAGVIELLEAADQLAQEIDDPELHSVRAALAVDLAELRALPTVDIEGIWLALDATAGQVARLRLVTPMEAPSDEPEDAEAPPPPADWRERLQQGVDAAVAKLGQLVQIRRRDEAYTPLLSPQYEGVLRQHLALLFEQAQLALLAGREQLYRETLEDARRWVEQYFALDEAGTAAVLEQIDALAQRTVTVELPQTLSSHQALRGFVRERRRDEVPAAGAVPAAEPAAATPAMPAPGAATPTPRVATPPPGAATPTPRVATPPPGAAMPTTVAQDS